MAQGDELLLGAVVEVALEPLALLVAGGDDPGPRRLDLGQLRLDLRLEPVVLDGRRRGRGHRIEQRRVLAQRGVVDDRPERLALALEDGERPARVRAGQLAGVPPRRGTRPSRPTRPAPRRSGRSGRG